MNDKKVFYFLKEVRETGYVFEEGKKKKKRSIDLLGLTALDDGDGGGDLKNNCG